MCFAKLLLSIEMNQFIGRENPGSVAVLSKGLLLKTENLHWIYNIQIIKEERSVAPRAGGLLR